jgi:hypothetical protein
MQSLVLPGRALSVTSYASFPGEKHPSQVGAARGSGLLAWRWGSTWIPRDSPQELRPRRSSCPSGCPSGRTACLTIHYRRLACAHGPPLPSPHTHPPSPPCPFPAAAYLRHPHPLQLLRGAQLRHRRPGDEAGGGGPHTARARPLQEGEERGGGRGAGIDNQVLGGVPAASSRGPLRRPAEGTSSQQALRRPAGSTGLNREANLRRDHQASLGWP